MESGKYLVTDNQGTAVLTGLYIGEDYTLTEIRNDLYFSTDPIVFRIVNNNGNYEFEIQSGTVKDSVITYSEEVPT